MTGFEPIYSESPKATLMRALSAQLSAWAMRGIAHAGSVAFAVAEMGLEIAGRPRFQSRAQGALDVLPREVVDAWA
jgi:hypothetical protein